VIIADVRDDSAAAEAFRRTVGEYYNAPAMRYVRSFMAIPLVNRDRLVGLLIMSSRERDVFTERHAGLALAIATHIAAALENARLFEQERRTSHELASLLEVSHNLASTLELAPLLDVVLEQMKAVADYDGASIVVLDGDHLRTVRRRASARADTVPGLPADVPMDRAESWWRLIAAGQAAIVGDMHGDEPLARAYRAMVGVPWEQSWMHYVHSWMAAPLALQDRVIGAVVLAHGDPHVYTQRHADLAVAIGTQAAAAIENARLYDHSDQRAREMATLLEVSRTLSSTLELETLLDTILDQIKVVADYDGAGIRTYDGETLRYIRRRAPTALDPSHEQLRGVKADQEQPEWQAITRREPVIIDDVRGDDPLARAYRAGAGEPFETSHLGYVRSCMAVPLTIADRVIGLFVLAHAQPGYYTPHHTALVMAIGAQAAAAIENARLYDQTDQRARELATLLDVSRAVASTLELRPLLDLILEQLKTVVDYRGATLGTIEGDDLFIAASRAVTPERASDRGMRFPLRRFGPIWEAISRGEPAIITDVHGDEPAAVEYRALNAALMDGPTHREIRSWMAVPLALGDRVIGMLSASQDVPNYFTPHHADLALAFANQASVAVENARLYGEAQGKAALEERQRLARELHDSVSQALFGIALGAGAARRRLDLDPGRVAESLDYVLSLADAALTEMRALIFELRPETLEKDGLVAALTRHAAATQARHEIVVETALCDEPDVPLATKEALYRIAQEAMHNAVKHARATRIDLVLRSSADAVSLEVRDNGAGFDPSQDFAGHLGLHSMRERMAGVGGTTSIVSAPGEGTHVQAIAPLGRSNGYDASPRAASATSTSA
jgi:GAF domain-containing protein